MEVRVNEEALYRGADPLRLGAGVDGADDRGDLPLARRVRTDVLPVEEEVRFDESLTVGTAITAQQDSNDVHKG